jgi:PAS domain S-box-containing protein
MSKSDPGVRRVAPAVWRYGLAVLSVAIATAVTFPLQGFGVRTSLYFPAVLLSTWIGGTGPGLLAVLLSILSINFFFVEPFFAFQFTARDIPHTVAFLFTALLISTWSSARKRAEDRLRGSEDALRKGRDELEEKVAARTADLSRSNEQLKEQASLLNLTHDTVFVRDMNDVITYWNRGAEEQYGWSSEEAVGRVTHELTQTSFSAPLEKINAELLATGRWEGELVHTRRDGSKVIVATRWALQRDQAHKPVAILETNNDITERKQAEENLRSSEAFLAQGQRISHTGSWSWNLSSGALEWSEEHFRIFGFDPETTKPSYELFLDTVHQEDRSFVAQALDEAVREKRGFDMEFRLALADGTVKHVHGVGQSVVTHSGELDHYIGTTVDISARKRAELLLAGEKHLLEMVATGDSLTVVLDALCRLVEELAPGALSSVLLLDPNGNKLRHGAAPSLPKAYTDAIDG